MHSLLAALAALALGTPTPALAPQICLPTVRYKGALYTGVPVLRRLNLVGSLRGVRPACRDTVPAPPTRDEPVALRRIGLLDPSLGVGLRGQPRIAYIVKGVFVQNPAFPLHDAVYGSRRMPDECAGWVASPVVTFIGRVKYEPFTFSLLSVAGKSFLVDARTRLDYPVTRRLRRGTPVTVKAVTCRQGTLQKLVARRLSLR